MKQKYFKKSMLEQLKNKFAHEFSFEITILPPVFKRYPLFFHLMFPICEKFDNSFSRPVGIVRIDNLGFVKLIKLDNQDFSQNRDFGKKYCYKRDIEFLKASLDKLFVSQPKFALFENKNYKSKYIPVLKTLVGEDFFKFYLELMSNEIKHTDIPKIFPEEAKQEVQTKPIESDLKLQLSNFVKKEIVPEFFGKSAYVRICFYQNFGEMLLKNFSEEQLSLGKLKFETTKCYAKAMNELSSVDAETDFLCRLILICLNALLIREKGELSQNYVDEINDSKTIFNDEIKLIKDEKTKKNLEKIMQSILKDYAKEKSTSAIFVGYKNVFLQ